MLLAAILFISALVIAITASSVLSRAAWQVRFPAIALWCWTASLFCGFILVISAFAITIVEAVGASESASLESGIAFFVSWVGLGGGGALAAYAYSSYERFGLGESLLAEHTAAIATSREELENFTIVRFESASPIAFAIPRRRSAEIFISRSLEEVLEPAMLSAVIRHEIAHIRYRHHHHLRLGILADACTPRFLAAGKRIRSSFALLIELVADDAAAKEAGAANLANALSRIASLKGDSSMTLRAERLTQRVWPVHKQIHAHHASAHDGISNHVYS